MDAETFASPCRPIGSRGSFSSWPITTASACGVCNATTRVWKIYFIASSEENKSQYTDHNKNENRSGNTSIDADAARLSPLAWAARRAGARRVGDRADSSIPALAPALVLGALWPQRHDLLVLLLRTVFAKLDWHATLARVCLFGIGRTAARSQTRRIAKASARSAPSRWLGVL